MHTVLIIDDEIRDIHMLRMLLEYRWGEEFNIITASGALEALTEINEFHPTLIFVDVQMPQMDGLAFLRLLEENSDIYAIIVSAHNDFSYTRGAIVAGARDYLLKPVQVSELTESLNKYFLWYQRHEQELRRKRNVDKRIRHLSAMLEKDIIFSIMNHQSSNYLEQLNDYLLMSNIVYDWGCCTAYRIDSMQDSTLSVQCYDRLARLRTNIRAQIYAKEIKMISAIINNTIIMYFFFHHKNHSECRLELKSISSDIAQHIKAIVGHEISYAIGKEFASNEGLGYSFQTCINKLNHPGEKKDSIEKNEDDTMDPSLVQHIVQHIRSQEIDTANALFSGILERLSEATSFKDSDSRFYITEMLSAAERLLFQQTMLSQDSYSHLADTPAEEFGQEALNLLLALESHYVRQTQRRQHQTISQICEYIGQKYDKQLTLSGLSHKFNINSYYLSKLFKKYTNEKFIDYLTRIRIQKAMELIQEGKYSVKEIAAMVGYNDQSYFSKVFKKITGQNPCEYRNIVSSPENDAPPNAAKETVRSFTPPESF